MRDVLITSSVLILAVMLLRFLFRKTISRRAQYALWGLVLLRLLLPVSLPAMKYSVLTAAEPVRETVSRAAEQPVYRERYASYPVTAYAPEELPDPRPGAVVVEGEGSYGVVDEAGENVVFYRQRLLTPALVLRIVWYGGMVLMALWFLGENLRFARRLRRTRVPLEVCLPLGEGGAKRRMRGVLRSKTEAFTHAAAESRFPVYLCDDIPTPCLFGLFRPAIYVTSVTARDRETLRYVLAHEETHARHLDPLWSLLRSLCLVIWWFDPLVWLAAYVSKTDGELACDESVLEMLGEDERILYGETLLRLIPLGRAGSPMRYATTMTAGKRQMKDRIKRIAEHKKPLAVALVITLVLAAVVCACTFTGAKGEPEPEPAGSVYPAGQPTLPPDPLPEEAYESPEAYLRSRADAMAEVSCYAADGGGEKTVPVLDRRWNLHKLGELTGLAPEGTLELYDYLIELRLDAEPGSILLVGGMAVTEDGWYDLEGQGGRILVLLRREDGSVSVLSDRVNNDDMGGLYYYEESPEEMLHDWYVREHELDLPLYTLDLLPQNREGNCPARRWDGDGWYIYIPIAGWEKLSGENKWVSRYRTGSSIVVRETTEEYMTDAQREKTAPGQEERFVEGEDGRLWLVSVQFDPANITDAAEIRGEPQALEAMMESFTLPGGRDRLRRTWTHTIPPTITDRLREAADRIFGAPQVSPTGPFFLSVEADGRRDEYRLIPGQTWSLDQNMGYLLTSAYYKWHTLTEEEIAEIDRDPASSPVMEIWNETDRFTIYAGSDALLWTELESAAEHWLCPEPRKDYSRPLYDYFLSSTARIAEMYRPEAEIAIRGAVMDYEIAARQMAEQYAAILLDRPSWYVGIPGDAAVGGVTVFDAYYGEDRPNFCFGMTIYLKLSHDPSDPNRSYFEAGAGLGDPIADGPYAGWYRWGGEVTAALVDGVWRFLGMGTGGACVWLPYGVGYGFPADFDLSAERLLDLYFLTWGESRDWRVMYALAHLPVEEVLAELTKLSEEQRQVIYRSMEAYNEEYSAVEGDDGDWYGRFDLEAYR